MPRSVDPFAYTNWESAPVLRKLLIDVKAHVDDAMHGDKAHKTAIEPSTEELAKSCIEALQELGMDDVDILSVVNRVYDQDVVATPA